MPAFPQEQPPIGQIVRVTLTTGSEVWAEYDGAQWWAHLDNDPNAAPVVNEFVANWSLE
jgi:hypothetical protein